MCHIRDRHRHPGQCDLSLQGGGSLRVPHPLAAESSYSGSYLNRSLRQTHHQHLTRTVPTPPEVMCSLDCAQVQFPKTGFVLFSPYCHTGVLPFGSFPQNQPIQPILPGHLGPMAINSCSSFLMVFLTSLSHISFKVNKHWLSICYGLGTELQVRVG